MENQKSEEKTEDVVLVGINAIEKTIGRSFIDLKGLMIAHDFPLRKIDREYTLNMNEFLAWVRKWGDGLPFSKITPEVLRARKKYLDIMALPKKDRKLTGINEIEKFMKIMPAELMRLKQDFGFPMVKTKDGGIYCLSLDDLYEWLEKYGIKDPIKVSYSKIKPLYLIETNIQGKAYRGDANKICEILHISLDAFLNYFKYDSCPIQKIPGTNQYETTKKDLMKFFYILAQETERREKNALNMDNLAY